MSTLMLNPKILMGKRLKMTRLQYLMSKLFGFRTADDEGETFEGIMFDEFSMLEVFWMFLTVSSFFCSCSAQLC